MYPSKNTGIIGLVVAFLISLFSSLGRDSALITTIAGFIMAVLYTICAGLLTFDNGPATYVGNHYFSAWAGFFISFAVFGSVLKEFLGVGGGATSSAAAAASGGELTTLYFMFAFGVILVVLLALTIFCLLYAGEDVEMDRI